MAQETGKAAPVVEPSNTEPGVETLASVKQAIVNELVNVVTDLTEVEERIVQKVLDSQNSLDSLIQANKKVLDEVNKSVADFALESRTGVASLQGMNTELGQRISDGFDAQDGRLSSVGSEVKESITDGLATLTNHCDVKFGDITTLLTDSARSLEQTIEGQHAILLNEFTFTKGELSVIKEKASSLFVAYSEMVGEISRLATEAAQDFSKTLLQATELQQVVENCQSIIAIFNDLKGSYETIASIAAEGLKTIVERKWMGPVEAAKDASVAVAALVNAFRTTKQERRDSRFDF